MKKKLTEKERIFCSKYVIYHNASRAAREAGYSEKTCKEIGNQNLTKVHIKAEIARLNKSFENHMAELGITKERTVAEIANLAYSTMASIHNSWIEKKEFDKLGDEVKRCIQTIDTKVEYKVYDTEEGKKGKRKIEFVKVSFYDKPKAIEILNKMMGWNETEKKDITSGGEKLTGTVVQTIDSESAKEITAMLKKIEDRESK